MLTIKFRDIVRATLSCECGNEGWIGVHPQGSAYHVVVPVDVQIARGVMACNRPEDGTPFGGYTTWIYFRCPPHEIDAIDGGDLKISQAVKTATELVSFLTQKGIEAQIAMDRDTTPEGPSFSTSSGVGGIELIYGWHAPGPPPPSYQPLLGTGDRDSEGALDQRNSKSIRASSSGSCGMISCGMCGQSWQAISDFLKDWELEVVRYKACPEDFQRGTYVFRHQCGGDIELPVGKFARSSRRGKSLIGSHACPGLCYYEGSLGPCLAVCEGSCYRRIAFRLKSRHAGNGQIGRVLEKKAVE